MKSDIKSKPFEILYVAAHEVACDGGGVALGHPRVYLHIDGESGEVTCPYCSRLYIYRAETPKTA